MYQVNHNDEMMFRGTNNECFEYILNAQAQSVDHATEFEGWEIVKDGD